jgi:hypothetical protein
MACAPVTASVIAIITGGSGALVELQISFFTFSEE